MLKATACRRIKIYKISEPMLITPIKGIIEEMNSFIDGKRKFIQLINKKKFGNGIYEGSGIQVAVDDDKISIIENNIKTSFFGNISVRLVANNLRMDAENVFFELTVKRHYQKAI